MRFLYTILAICVSLLIYGLFGAFCGVIYKAVQDAPISQNTPTTSPMLAKFLDSAETSKEFSLSELQEGVLYIMIDSATRKTKAGEAIVLPALPVFEETAEGVCVSFPMYLNGSFVKMQTNLRCFFSIKNGFVFEKLQIGKAKLPAFLSKEIAEIIYKSYAEFIAQYETKMLSLKVEKLDRTYKISK